MKDEQEVQLERLALVTKRILELCKDDEYLVEDFSKMLEEFLDGVAQEDGFGTERQWDPRGDMRSQEWSMWFIQGIDNP